MTDERLVDHHGVTPELAPDVFVADTARVIGDVRIGEGSSVWYGTVIRGDVYHIRLGRAVNVQDNSVIHVTTGQHATLVEDEVTVGHRAILHGCTVRRRALIGMGAVVMDACDIGEEAMVAAGALVTPGTVIEPRTLAVGSPAKPKRALTDDEIASLAESAEHYRDLARSYRGEPDDDGAT